MDVTKGVLRAPALSYCHTLPRGLQVERRLGQSMNLKCTTGQNMWREIVQLLG